MPTNPKTRLTQTVSRVFYKKSSFSRRSASNGANFPRSASSIGAGRARACCGQMALQVLQACARSGHSMAELLEGVDLFPQVLLNVRLQPGQDWRSNQRLQAETVAVQSELAEMGRVLIRASGTEPLLRVMVEASDAVQASACAQRLAEAARVQA